MRARIAFHQSRKQAPLDRAKKSSSSACHEICYQDYRSGQKSHFSENNGMDVRINEIGDIGLSRILRDLFG